MPPWLTYLLLSPWWRYPRTLGPPCSPLPAQGRATYKVTTAHAAFSRSTAGNINTAYTQQPPPTPGCAAFCRSTTRGSSSCQNSQGNYAGALVKIKDHRYRRVPTPSVHTVDESLSSSLESKSRSQTLYIIKVNMLSHISSLSLFMSIITRHGKRGTSAPLGLPGAPAHLTQSAAHRKPVGHRSARPRHCKVGSAADPPPQALL